MCLFVLTIVKYHAERLKNAKELALYVFWVVCNALINKGLCV
jgi:hypothetical protein